MNPMTDSVQHTGKHGGDESAVFGFLLTDANFLVILVPVLMLLFFYEHKRQLKKFKKVWKEKLESGLVSLRDSHRKRLDEFKIQPYSMKAEWGTLKNDVEKRLEDLRNLKIEVNSQLTSLKLDFQTQVSHLQHTGEKPVLGKLTAVDVKGTEPFYLDSKVSSMSSLLEAKLLLMMKYVDEKVQQNATAQFTHFAESIRQVETHISSLESSILEDSTPKLQNGQCD